MNKFLFAVSIFLCFMTSAAQAEVSIDTENLALKFSDYGDLLSVRACLPACSDPDARQQEFDSYRGLISMNRDSGVVFELERFDGDKTVGLVFTNLVSSEVRTWRIPHKGYLLGMELSKPQDMALASGAAFNPPEVPGFGAWLESLRYVVFDAGKIRQYGLEDEREAWQQDQAWMGYRNRYWAAMIRPEQVVDTAIRTSEGQSEGQLDLSPIGDDAVRYLVYAGPVEPLALEAAHPDLERLMYSGLWFWLRWIAQGFFLLLGSIQALVPGWAVAIIAMSLLVQLIMWPVNQWAERLQDDVRNTELRIAPELSRIKKELKGAEQAERILALYKQEKVHPLYSLKSMAGVLVIIPVFIGAFNMLSENIWLSGESFLWIRDLSLPDAVATLPFSIPFLGDGVNLLPFIMIALSVPASMLRYQGEGDSATHARHSRNLILMSLLFFLLFYTFPAGMVLYWVINNAVSLISTVARRSKT